MNYIQYAQTPTAPIQYFEPISAWDSYGFSKDNPTRLYYESKGLTFEDYMKNTTEAQRRADMKVSLGESKEEADNKAKVQGYRNAALAAKERILIEEGKLEAPKAINLLLAPTLPSTWIGAGTGAMDIKTGEAKDTPEGQLWNATRVAQDLLLPVAAAGAYKGIRSGIKVADGLARRAYAPYDLYRTIGETKLPLGSSRYYIGDGKSGYVLYESTGRRAGSLTGGYASGNGIATHESVGVDGAFYPALIKSENGAHGVSEDLYNVAIDNAIMDYHPGLETGHNLKQPLKTLKVTSKFPSVDVPTKDPIIRIYDPDGNLILVLNDVKLLTGTSGKPIPIRIPENHLIEMKPEPKFIKKASFKNGKFVEEKVLNPKYQKADGIVPSKTISFGEVPGGLGVVDGAVVELPRVIESKTSYTPTEADFKPWIDDAYNTQGLSYRNQLMSNSYVLLAREPEGNLKSSLDKIILTYDGQYQHIPDSYVTELRHYYGKNGYSLDLYSDDLLRKVVAQLIELLSKDQTGLLKGKPVWHGSSKDFDTFDWLSHIGLNTMNGGVIGGGNYFFTLPSLYGVLRGGIPGYNTQPYLIDGVSDIVDLRKLDVKGSGLQAAGNKLLETPNTAGLGPQTSSFFAYTPELAVKLNTGIKSLFPHPSTANGAGFTRSWLDPRVNYGLTIPLTLGTTYGLTLKKHGGKMNYLNYIKDSQY